MTQRVLLAMLVAFGAAACSKQEAAPDVVAVPVVVEPAAVGALEEKIGGTGELAAPDRAVIAAEIDGRVTEVRVDEGMHVAAGDVLIAIDPERRRLDVESARAGERDAVASSEVAQREYARAKALHEQGIASDSVLDQRATELSRAEARRDSASAQRGVAEKALRDASVRAPFAGLIARRDISRGDYVRPGQALLEVVALDPIEVEFSVAERDSARVAVGQPVYVNVDPYPSEKFVGNVSAVSPVIDPSTRTMRVKARIPNTDGRLRPGLFARTDLGVARRDHVVFVPAEAVLQRSDGEVVFVVGDDQRARRVVVKTGVQRDGRVEILDGVKGAEAIVVRGQGTLSAGALVKRTQPDALDEQPPGGAELPGASLASEQPAAGSAR